MAQATIDEVTCSNCQMPRIDGITHHLSSCPYNAAKVRSEIKREDRRDRITGRTLKWKIQRWFDYHPDVWILLLALAVAAVFIYFFMFYHE